MDVRTRHSLTVEASKLRTSDEMFTYLVKSSLNGLTYEPSRVMVFNAPFTMGFGELFQLVGELGLSGWTATVVPTRSWLARWYRSYSGFPRGYELHVR